jgi:branched-chain amino acid transport system ATP-binding protein
MSELALEAKGLTKRYGALCVTDGVSIRLGKGARHALIGPNGAGKSTLVGLLSGTIRANAGRVFLFGEDATSFKPAQRTKRGLVRTFQISSLFANLTIVENIYLAVSAQRGEGFDIWRPAGRRREILDAVEALLDEFGLKSQGNRRTCELGYGQQRLVEMAIALALKPKVLLLDEPAAGIPSGETRLLMEAIERLPQDIGVLMIEHDMELVRRFAKEATVLVQGAVLISGSVASVMASEEVRKVYLGAVAAKAFGGNLVYA